MKPPNRWGAEPEPHGEAEFEVMKALPELPGDPFAELRSVAHKHAAMLRDVEAEQIAMMRAILRGDPDALLDSIRDGASLSFVYPVTGWTSLLLAIEHQWPTFGGRTPGRRRRPESGDEKQLDGSAPGRRHRL